MIICNICKREFKSLITNSHLKTHGISTDEYRTKFGDESLSSPEYRAAKSEKMKGSRNPSFGKRRSWSTAQKEKLKNRIPHNKGKSMSTAQKEKLSKLAKARNAVWEQNDSHPLIGTNLSDARRQKISESVKRYATEHPDVMRHRSAKAIETKRANGYDFKPFKDRHHTPQTKTKIKETMLQAGKERRERTLVEYAARINDAKLTLLNDIEDHFLHLRCECGYEFSRTKQIFRDSKRGTSHDICDVCHPKDYKKSNAELAILDGIRNRGFLAESGNRSEIYPLELDIYIPSEKLAIEYCGLYWHGELSGKDRLYHQRKMELCADRGIRLITIFEDEWINKPDIVNGRLDAILGVQRNKVYARKCDIRELSPKEANEFLNMNHLQGSGRSNARFGLFHGESLVSVMTFSKSNIAKRTKQWEIDRFASRIGLSVVGGASKLFKAFVKKERPESVVSFADRRWSDTTAFYSQLGFELDGMTPPSYWYFLKGEMKRLHRFSLRKADTDDQSKTEWENRMIQGYDRIWDCGHLRFLLHF